MNLSNINMLTNVLNNIIHRLLHVWLFVLMVLPAKSLAVSPGILPKQDYKDVVPQSRVPEMSENSTTHGTLEYQLYGLVEFDVENYNIYNNPFDTQEIELRATFIHEETREEIRFFGFYDGDGQGNQEGGRWKIRFMPHKTGVWSYTYSWSDGSVGDEGSFSVVDSEFPGLIGSDSEYFKIWRVANKDNQIPFYITVSKTLFDTIDDEETDRFLDYVKYTLGANGIAVRLTNRVWLDCQETTSCSPSESKFSLINWHALDKYVEKLRQRELGLNLMFYIDDQGKPLFAGESEMEEMLFKYTIARIGAFPLLSFDSGIDISEYRSSTWHDWFATRILELDPWDHPVGSRHGGGSGEFTCDTCTYDALGDIHPTYDEILQSMSDTQKPLFYTDRWREDYRRGNFDRDSIRKIAWHASLSGGAGFIIGGIHNGLELFDYETDLDAPWQWKAFSDFWHGRIRQWSTFVTCNDLLSVGFCLGEVGEQYVVYLENGEETHIDLPLGKSDYLGTWLNPRSGEYYDENPVKGGEMIAISPPQTDHGDWVLHLYQEPLPIVADAGGPYEGSEGETLLLQARSPELQGQTRINFAWDLDDDGNFDDAEGPQVKHYAASSGDFIIRLRVTDHTGASHEDMTSMIIKNVKPQLLDIVATPTSENGFAKISGTISDPDPLDSFTLQVNWEPGSSETFSYPKGSTSVDLSHRYLDDPSGTNQDTFPVVITLKDDEGGVYTTSLAIRVNNLPPIVNTNPDRTWKNKIPLRFIGEYNDPGSLDKHSILWNFGDGSSLTGSLFPIHSFANPGIYYVTLTVTDDDGGVGSDISIITILGDDAEFTFHEFVPLVIR